MPVKDIEETRVAYPGLGVRMRWARRETGLSQEAVAEKVGCSWMTIHRQEADDRAIKYKQLAKIAGVYGVSIDRFVPVVDVAALAAVDVKRDRFTVIFFKGGPLEKTVDLDLVEIPDLWEIANKIPDPAARDRVLETWHIAQDLLKHIRATARPE